MPDRAHLPFATIALAFSVGAVQATSPAPPWSYKQVTPDGRYVFVMISPLTAEKDAGRWIEPKAAEIRAIRQTYTRSGMYRNDGSTEPLWTVDWYAFRIAVASDGVHLVRRHPWDDETITFFANGVLLRNYSAKELVNIPLFPRDLYPYDPVEEGRLDDANCKYTLSTFDGNRFVFDLRTGEVIGGFRWGRVVLAGALILGICACVHVIRRRRARQLVKAAESSAPPETP